MAGMAGRSLWLLLQHGHFDETHVLLQRINRKRGESVQNHQR
jgi:hypothetical protein